MLHLCCYFYLVLLCLVAALCPVACRWLLCSPSCHLLLVFSACFAAKKAKEANARAAADIAARKELPSWGVYEAMCFAARRARDHRNAAADPSPQPVGATVSYPTPDQSVFAVARVSAAAHAVAGNVGFRAGAAVSGLARQYAAGEAARARVAAGVWASAATGWVSAAAANAATTATTTTTLTDGIMVYSAFVVPVLHFVRAVAAAVTTNPEHLACRPPAPSMCSRLLRPFRNNASSWVPLRGRATPHPAVGRKCKQRNALAVSLGLRRRVRAAAQEAGTVVNCHVVVQRRLVLHHLPCGGRAIIKIKKQKRPLRVKKPTIVPEKREAVARLRRGGRDAVDEHQQCVLAAGAAARAATAARLAAIAARPILPVVRRLRGVRVAVSSPAAAAI
ncbi:hypothetical protein MBANPS3_011367 [Mucor bainieri]